MSPSLNVNASVAGDAIKGVAKGAFMSRSGHADLASLLKHIKCSCTSECCARFDFHCSTSSGFRGSCQ